MRRRAIGRRDESRLDVDAARDVRDAGGGRRGERGLVGGGLDGGLVRRAGDGPGGVPRAGVPRSRAGGVRLPRGGRAQDSNVHPSRVVGAAAHVPLVGRGGAGFRGGRRGGPARRAHAGRGRRGGGRRGGVQLAPSRRVSSAPPSDWASSRSRDWNGGRPTDRGSTATARTGNPRDGSRARDEKSSRARRRTDSCSHRPRSWR